MVGQKIVSIDMMSDKDLSKEGWDGGGEVSAVLTLEDGTRLYASRDYEGNGPGAIFGTNKNGKDMFVVYPEGGDE